MKRFPLVVLFALLAAVSTSSIQKTQPPAGQKSQPRIDEIVLEARQGQDLEPFGPGFKITFRRDGTALFTGIAKVKLIGEFEGTISSEEFERLQGVLVARNYDRMPEDPVHRTQIQPAAGTAGMYAYDNSPYMITTVVYEGGKTKRVFRPTNAMAIDQARIPKELFQIEQAVFDAATHIRWAKIK